MNVMAWVVDALKTHPESVQLPEYIAPDTTPLELAEARSRLQQIAQVATELRRLVDQELAGKIPVGLRYGDQIFRPSNGKGTAKVQDDPEFWGDVISGLKTSPSPVALLGALFPASSVRITALPKLAAALSMEADDLKRAHVVYDPPSTPLSVMPIQKAPKYLQDLEEGELR